MKHDFAVRFALELYRKKAIYSFIPKNACSTLRYSLGIENGFITGPKHFRWIHDNLHTFSADLRGLVTAEYSFTILRCPFDRLASCYLHKVVGSIWDVWSLVPPYATEEKPETITFRRFVEILDNSGILRSNMHWQPQIEFLVYKNYSDYFAVEQFDKAKKTLKEKIDFEIHETRHIYKHGRDDFEKLDGNYTDTPAYEIASMKREGKIPSTNSLYDPDIYDQVSEIFKADLKLYKNKIGLEFTVKR